MHEKLDFEDPVSMAQRIAIAANLIYAELLSESFNVDMEKLANKIHKDIPGGGCTIGEGGEPGKPGSRAPTKGYSRSFNKVYDDYLNQNLDGGRAAWIVDALRCLITGSDVKTVKRIVQELSEESEGLIQIKNPFEDVVEKRAQRSHLMLMNCITMYDSKKTVGELVTGEAAAKVFKDFRSGKPDLNAKGQPIPGTRKHAHQEPNERWELICDKAIEILKDPQLADVSAKIACEVQITFSSIKHARHDMHDAYDVTRATKAVQLYNQFAGTSLTPEQRLDAKDIHTACIRGQMKVVEKYIKAAGQNINEKAKKPTSDQTLEGLEKDQTPILLAVKNNHPDVLKLLLDNNAEQEDGLTEQAQKDGFVEIVKQLKLSADMASKALLGAIKNGDVALVRTYMAQGANPNKETSGETPLGMAAKSNNVSIVKALLSDPPASRRSSKKGATKPQRKESVVYQKAEVDMPNSKGETPLQIAAKVKGLNIGVVEELLKNSADVHKLSLEALMMQENAIELAPVVVKAGLDPNKRTDDGDTLLCRFAAAGNAEATDILVSKCHADPNMRGKMGKPPLKIAKDGGHTALLDILYNNGAVDNFGDRCMRCFTSPRFKHGLYGCCDHGCPHFCSSIWCGSSCTLARTWSDYGMCGGACGGLFCSVCGPLSICLLRREAAKQSGIKETCCGECCAVCFCALCSLAQIENEAIAQGITKKGDFCYWFTDENFWCDDDCWLRELDLCADPDEDEGCCSLAICCPCLTGLIDIEEGQGDNAVRCSSTSYICCSTANVVILPVCAAVVVVLGCLAAALDDD